MLKKEIWCLRDEYEKLDKLLKEKDIEFSSSSTTCSTSESVSWNLLLLSITFCHWLLFQFQLISLRRIVYNISLLLRRDLLMFNLLF